MKHIDITQFKLKPVDLWMNQWLLLTAGTPEDYNMMTVAWGSIGCMWAKPFVQIVVRPQRHTFNFTEKYDHFTLCAFPDEFKKDLNTLGTLSGRDGNKLKKTNLTVRNSSLIPSPSYNEASLILECKKMYWQDFNPKGFVDKTGHNIYPEKDYHRAYFGEIVAAFEK